MSAHTELHDWCDHLGGIEYLTTKPVPWEIGASGSGLVYTVPESEIFDVSIPWFLRWLLDPHNPKYLKAACIHDHMLLSGWDRPTSGAAFHSALRAAGVGSFVRFAMFFSVTLRKWN